MTREIFESASVTMGILVGLVIAIIIIKICNTNGKFKTDYDERQKIMIGKSYKYAMISAWVMMGIYIVLDIGGIKIPMDNSLAIFSMLFVSLMVHTSYSVWTDAYFGSNSNNKRYAIMSVVITLVNIAATCAYIKGGELIVDGVLTFKAINAECALMFLILGVEFFIKGIMDKNSDAKEDDDDEES